MLVLSRNENESIMVGENVEIMIVGIRGNKVQLGITAPRFIPVHRKEVFEAIQNEGVKRHNKHSNQREKSMRRLSRRFESAKALCVDSFCYSKK
jgi:carbon storage regulator